MSLRTLAAIPLAAALTLLAACATKPVVTHVAERPYNGPRITLHTAPGVTAFAIQPADPLPTAISYLNARRAELGLNAITADPLVAQAAAAHAHYLEVKFELRDGRGKLVSCQIAPLTSTDTGRNTAVCTPFSPLHPGTTYTAHATGRLTQQFGVANAPFDVRWSFSTIAAPVQIDNVVAQAANR
ncbi:hypothetical protein EHZ19_31605 [Paraburkholderia bannensis]|nr:hypothetical protein EHZ19_31605 [Paraburkholderia bannensis]